ncbi:MAG: hypothetical protein ABR611_05815 [Chthoniobacterales bacterium]
MLTVRKIRKIFYLAGIALACLTNRSEAASTINATNAFSWSGNTGFWNWRPSTADGVNVGAFICQGYIYGANVGWINMGTGNPANHIQYQNNSATDFGVNFTIDPSNPSHAFLRGFAYGANIGWINFEDTGNPYVILSNCATANPATCGLSQLRGYVWSANVGWINLDDLNVFVSTDVIDPGVDTDGNGLPDAWEYIFFGNIGVDPNADPDGDGETNIGEYRVATNPTNVNSVLHSARQLNISTRMRVQSGDNVLIGGFIITGTELKRVILRGIGPSLTPFGVPGALQDTTLELFNSSSTSIGFNDNWRDTNEAEIQATGLPPGDDRESAIVQTLAPGAYTAVLRGRDNTEGIGVVEGFDLTSNIPTKLANISTRGFVEAGDNVMIGGFIVGAGVGNNGAGSARVVVRAIGPSLTQFGVPNALVDPTLELHDSNGAVIGFNDNWQESQMAEIQATGLAPSDTNESAIVRTLVTGAYTAIVRGNADGVGVGLVEAYNVP